MSSSGGACSGGSKTAPDQGASSRRRIFDVLFVSVFAAMLGLDIITLSPRVWRSTVWAYNV